MDRSHPQLTELLFKLEQDEDDWPPFAVEGLWCEPVDGHYRVRTCPLFVKGLSVDDVIAARLDQDKDVESFEILRPSARTTMWVMMENEQDRETVLAALKSIGCNITGGMDAMPSLYSVDIPPEASLAAVDEVVIEFERQGQAAIAYPSLRHAEPE